MFYPQTESVWVSGSTSPYLWVRLIHFLDKTYHRLTYRISQSSQYHLIFPPKKSSTIFWRQKFWWEKIVPDFLDNIGDFGRFWTFLDNFSVFGEKLSVIFWTIFSRNPKKSPKWCCKRYDCPALVVTDTQMNAQMHRHTDPWTQTNLI